MLRTALSAAEMDPKSTAVAPVKFVPVMITTVPPVAGPMFGEMAVTVGTGTPTSKVLLMVEIDSAVGVIFGFSVSVAVSVSPLPVWLNCKPEYAAMPVASLTAAEPPVRVPLPFNVSGMVMVGSGVAVATNGLPLSSSVTAAPKLVPVNTFAGGSVLKLSA